MLRFCATIFFSISGLTAAVEALPTPRSAAALTDSFGINVVVYDDDRHERIVVPRLAELGIRHLRVGLYKLDHKDYRGTGLELLTRNKALGAAGYRLTGIFNPWATMEEFRAICDFLLPEGLHQAEGPNEPWHKHEGFRWREQAWPHGPRLYMQDLHTMLRSDPSTADLPIISFSGTTSGYGSIEEWLDYGNEHIYTDDGAAITEGNALAAKIARCRSTNYPTVPLQFTESGYNCGSGDKPGIRPTSLWMQARGIPRLYLEAFRHDLTRLFIYGLHMRHDQGFSLLHQDGTPKPAFHAVRDLLILLGGTDQAEADLTPLAGTLDIPVPSVHHLLVRRGDGVTVLVLWNDVDGWDETTKQDIVHDEVPVTLTLENPARLVQFRPCTDGVTATDDTATAVNALVINVPDHPVVIEMR